MISLFKSINHPLGENIMNGKNQITISRIKAEQTGTYMIFSAYGKRLVSVQLSNGFKLYHAGAINLLTPSLKQELDNRVLEV
jgi:hypothetical protein